jgi:hypothetical protein
LFLLSQPDESSESGDVAFENKNAKPANQKAKSGEEI